MRKPFKLSTLFYIFNLILLTLGIYLYHVYGAFRFLIVYSILNIVLYALFSRTGAVEGVDNGTVWSSLILNKIVIVIIILLMALGAVTLQSVYVRPNIVSILAGLTLSLVIISLVEMTRTNLSSRKLSTALSTFVIFMLLYVYLSIYLVQPSGLNDVPLYATVDAYRDYINAQRLLKLARIVPEYMVLADYYKVFPVVPLWLATINLVSNLPIPAIHITLATLNITSILVSLTLLSRAVSKATYEITSSQTSLLPVLLLLLYPILIDSMFTLTPLMFSLLLVSLCTYLFFKTILESMSLGSMLTIIILSIAVVPLHATSSIMMIALYILCTIIYRRNIFSNVFKMFAMISTTVFIVYTIFPFIPFTSLYNAIKGVIRALEEITTTPSVVTEKVVRTYVYSINEIKQFSYALSNAYLSSFLTVSLAILLKEILKQQYTDSKLHSKLHLHVTAFYCAVLSLSAFVVGYTVQLWRIDFRYFLFPTIPLIVLPLTILIVKLSKGLKSFEKLTILTVLLIIVFSVSFSPQFLHEINPDCARLIPTESEKYAGIFVATFIDYSGQRIRQIVSDWPYYAYVRSLIWSQSIGVEHHIKIPTPMYEAIDVTNNTVFVIRDYFYESVTLQRVSHVKPLLELKQKSSVLTKIFDSNSASIYLTTKTV